jgi:23S rRNA (cytidine1920-2'-O)/16S rRNA (cytidine1409-2'-O)-methyltransferase
MGRAPGICASWANFLFFGAPNLNDATPGRAAPILETATAVTARSKSQKKRLDVLLVERALAQSRQKAQAMVLAGQVRVKGQRADKPGAMISHDAEIELVGGPPPYVSRGGRKLEGALEEFGVHPEGRICLDAGCSTGGFTDCLLQHGAARVYAVDVTTSQLAWKLRQDSRVVPMEANVRYLDPKALAERPSLVTVDVAFISVAKVLPRLAAAAAPGAEFLILVKPQFELERGEVGRGGIVRNPRLHERAIQRVRAAVASAGLEIQGVRPSRVTGAEGNQEFFLHAIASVPNSRTF